MSIAFLVSKELPFVSVFHFPFFQNKLDFFFVFILKEQKQKTGQTNFSANILSLLFSCAKVTSSHFILLFSKIQKSNIIALCRVTAPLAGAELAGT